MCTAYELPCDEAAAHVDLDAHVDDVGDGAREQRPLDAERPLAAAVRAHRAS